MSQFEAGRIVLVIDDVLRRHDMARGFWGIVEKQYADMGRFASRFAPTVADLSIEGKFKPVTSTGATYIDLLRMAFGGGDRAPYILPPNHILLPHMVVTSVAGLSDETISALVKNAKN